MEKILNSAGIEMLEEMYVISIIGNVGGGYYLCLLTKKSD